MYLVLIKNSCALISDLYMGDSIFLSLVQNAAILLSVSILYEYLWVKNKKTITIWNQLTAGTVVGFIAIVVILSSWELKSGIIFDARSVVLSISGLFFGLIPTIIAIFIAGLYRFLMGGDGMFMGIAVIVSSGGIGILWKYIFTKTNKLYKWKSLLLMGFLVHIIMLFCILLLPRKDILDSFINIFIPILFVYPIITMLLGLFMSKQMQDLKNRSVLSKREDNYSRLYESMNDAFVVLDNNGKVIESNSAYREMLGYSKEEILCLTCHDLTPKKWVDLDNQIMSEEVMAHGNSRLYEKECTRKDGSLLPIEVRIHQLKDENGNPNGFWAMVRDISQRKQAQLEIENERSHLKLVLETVPDMIWVKNPEGVYLSGNQKFLEFNNLTGTSLIGKSDFDLYPEDLAKVYFQKDVEVLDTLKRVRFVNWTISAKDGKRILTETIKNPMFDAEGKVIGVLGVCKDITEIKKAEEELVKAKEKAEESDKLKSIFLANMSHEIRTPMNAIMGFTELLVDSDLEDSDRLQFVNIIQHSGKRLLQLIDDIVDLSKLEMQQMAIKKTNRSLRDLMNTSVAFFENNELLKTKTELCLRLNYPEKYFNFVVNTDENRFRQILDNLINNSIKFSEKGIIELGFSLVEIKGKSFVEIYVKDQGMGIPKEKHDIIFEHFRQGDEEQFNDGTGLGLSICKGLVELLEGDIRFESEPGEGSTFYFTIPCDYEFKNNVHTSEADYCEDLKNKNILIAESDYNSYLYVKKLFEEENVKIFHADNSLQMMQIAKLDSPDLIILDTDLPGENCLKCLSEFNKTDVSIKIIAQTTSVLKGEEELCLKAGCDGYIRKPFSKEQLLSEVRRVLA
ncbi:PAS domain S-box protein [Marinifilum sp. RC60d5]|uniref:PAS domain S-box protein n=1 Tax=Marinifilum sp. RC60d5 TaxID=3458414 RepID=UPI004035AC6A